MSWSVEIPLLLRSYIGDTATPQKYADADLKSYALTAAFLVVFDLSLKQTYDVDVVGQTITPDPTDRSAGATRDTDYIALIVARAGSIIFNTEVRLYGAQAIAIKDGSSSIDLKRDLKSLIQIAKTFDEKYAFLRQSYIRGDGNLGVAIMSRDMRNPFIYGPWSMGFADSWRSYSGYDWGCP